MTKWGEREKQEKKKTEKKKFIINTFSVCALVTYPNSIYRNPSFVKGQSFNDKEKVNYLKSKILKRPLLFFRHDCIFLFLEG